MTKPKHRILFLCTANCCRSQMAEAILKHVDSDRFEALSAGAMPAGYVHPLVTEVLEQMDIPVTNQHSKSWEEFNGQPIDLLITVCGAAAAEVCPVWLEGPPVVHWPLPDPVMQRDPDADPITVGLRVAERLMLKIRRMTALDWENNNVADLREELEKLAEL